MTSGDEPMLPQPADDNAPMISGRGTKIIADARGAYLAGNLDALIEGMNEFQRLRFENALIKQVIIFARQHLAATNYPEIEPHLPDILRMLDFPTEENAEVVSSFRIHNPSIIHPLSALILRPDFYSQFIFSALMSQNLLGMDFREASEWAHDWRVATAWAILQGKDPDFVETFVE